MSSGPSQEFVSFTFVGKELQISEQLSEAELAPLFSDAWTGSCVWPGAKHLSAFLESDMKDTLSEKRVLELGAGCGLVGICACLLGADVTATDQDFLSELVMENAQRNLPAEKLDSQYRYHELMWGLPVWEGEEKRTRAFDYIFVADCINSIYGDSWRDLAVSLHYFFTQGRADGRQTVCYLTYCNRGQVSGSETDDLMITFLEFSKDMFVSERVRDMTDTVSLWKMQLPPVVQE